MPLQTTGQALAAIGKVTDRVEISRYATHGVHASGACLEATDGRIAACITLDGDGELSEPGVYERLPLWIRGSLTVETRDGCLCADAERRTIRAERIEGKFPDLDQAIPALDGVVLTVQLDLTLLSRLCAVATAVGDKRTPTVTLRFYGPEAAVRVDSKSFVGVIMPCAQHGGEGLWPAGRS